MMTTPNVLAFAPMYNSAKRRDATGAFQPEALGWTDLHDFGGDAYREIDNTKTKAWMRDHISDEIYMQKPNAVALFCHGWSSGVQFGFSLPHVDALAAALALGSSSVRVALYCCSTGSGPGVGGDNGFADCLRDALCRAGAVNCQVDAHDRAGHTTKNPYVRRFDGMGSNVGGVGGYYIVAPGTALWKPWRAALATTDLRFRFPFVSVAEIHGELAAE